MAEGLYALNHPLLLNSGGLFSSCFLECTGKLFDRTTTELTVSSYYSPFHIQARVFSLNNIQNSWAARDGSGKSRTYIFIAVSLCGDCENVPLWLGENNVLNLNTFF